MLTPKTSTGRKVLTTTAASTVMVAFVSAASAADRHCTGKPQPSRRRSPGVAPIHADCRGLNEGSLMPGASLAIALETANAMHSPRHPTHASGDASRSPLCRMDCACEFESLSGLPVLRILLSPATSAGEFGATKGGASAFRGPEAGCLSQVLCRARNRL